MDMVLKSRDVVVLLELAAIAQEPWTFQRLAAELSISPSAVHAGVRRATAARLLVADGSGDVLPVLPALPMFAGEDVPTFLLTVFSMNARPT